jgi:hypothetical protein
MHQKGKLKKERGKEKMGSKRVKLMQNKEKLRLKGHNRNQKTALPERENVIFGKGGE